MRNIVAILIVLLIVLHQDFWNWHTHEPLVLGFVPAGLGWHVGISLAAAATGLLVARYCWPQEDEAAGGVAPARRGGQPPALIDSEE